MSIELHPTLGINPHMGCCPRCGQDNGELILIGRRTNILQCGQCETKVYGHRNSEPCPKCGARWGTWMFVGIIGKEDKIPGGLCNTCKEEKERFDAIIAEGGIYWKCKECEQNGVLRPTAPLCAAVREKAGIPSGPVGVEFNKCQEHTPQ